MKQISVFHGGYQVNEYEVDITQEMRDVAFEFAEKIKKGDNQYSRLLPDHLQNRAPEDRQRILTLEIQRTYVGKLGELAFLELLREKGIRYDTTGMFDIYEGQKNTDSYDFVTKNNKTVDVKTGFRSNHTRLLVNMQQFRNLPKDYYVAVKLNAQDASGNDKLIVLDSVKTAIIKGYVEWAFLSKIQEHNFGEGSAKCWDYSRLMDIDRLIPLFR